MKYQEVREAFPKCGITVSTDGIGLVIPIREPPQWVYAFGNCETGDAVRVFKELTDTCDEIRIDLSPGNSTRFLFCMAMPVEHEKIYSPVQPEMTTEELDKVTREVCSNMEIDKNFLEIFRDIDLNDEYEVLEGVKELLHRTDDGVLLSLPSIKQWDILHEASEDFRNVSKLGSVSVEPPDRNLDFGTIEFYMESNERRVFHVPKRDMPAFRKMINAASGFSIASNIEHGFANFVFDIFS